MLRWLLIPEEKKGGKREEQSFFEQKIIDMQQDGIF